MIVKKNIRKYSIEYTLIQGEKVFKFQEYTDDFWADKKIEEFNKFKQNSSLFKNNL